MQAATALLVVCVAMDVALLAMSALVGEHPHIKIFVLCASIVNVTVHRTMHAYKNGLCPGQDIRGRVSANSPVSIFPELNCDSICNSAEPRLVTPQASTFSTNVSAPNLTSENVEFLDSNPAFDYDVEGHSDPTRGVADMADTGLGAFLQRPILIKEFTWRQGLDFFETFDPWSLFYNDPKNINRLANFNLLRSRLCVKFVVNGNGFYYGRLIASYNPLPATDQVTQNRGMGIIQDVVGASQRPHIYVNPTECQGGTLCLPFYHYQNALSIPAAQWSDMGRITMTSINHLRNCNGVATSSSYVTVSVFAWAEDVNMSIPTSSNPAGITPQSDEYGITPVSAMASTVARVAGLLTKAPVIGPFAKATQVAAGGVGNIASLFGMSRPAVIDPIQIYKPEYVGGLANTNVPDGTNKLSLDVKQEVTVDPSITGVSGTDEMTIASIVQRESFYTSFPWDPVGGVASGAGYKLFQTQVMPTVCTTFGTGAYREYHNMPCGMVALPFKYWGGSMEFRFQIVSSNFHKGRIRICWDPHNINGGGNSTGYNTMYTKVVDIADMRDFTFKVGWGQEYSFLPVRNNMQMDNGAPIQTYGLGPAASTVLQEVFGNGTLSVFVVNDLTIPNSDPSIDASVDINVFVNMCDDARFAEPSSKALEGISYFPSVTPEALVVPQSSTTDMTLQEAAPVSTDSIVACGPMGDSSDHTMDVFFGEEVTSVRQLLKRYCLHAGTISGVHNYEARGLTMDLKQPDFPYYFGWCPDGAHRTPSGDGRFNYCHMTFLNYFTPAYVGYRGGLRWKHLVTRTPTNTTGELNGNYNSTFMSDNYASVVRGDGITRQLTAPAQYEPYSYDTRESILRSTVSGPAVYMNSFTPWSIYKYTDSFIEGGFATPQQVNPCLEVEMPYYTNRRFYSARRINNLDPRSVQDENPGVHTLSVTGTKSAILSYVSTAEDFSLSFFIGVPVMYALGDNTENGVPAPI